LIPVMFVLGLISILYLVFVFCHCVPMLQVGVGGDRLDEKLRRDATVQLIIFHILTAMLLICYARSIMTSPGGVPDDDAVWSYMPPDSLSGADPLPSIQLQEVKSSGHRRHCKWCGKYKPDRCHHCRVCRTCVLKMDHHCPWIYNCVGFRNYKFFFLLLFYTVCDLHFIIWNMMPSVSTSISDNGHFGTMFFLLFGESLACFLGFFVTGFFTFHIWLTWNSMTTIEFCEKSLPKKGSDEEGNESIYNLGPAANFRAALGKDLVLALLPTAPRLDKGGGLAFPVNPAIARDVNESRRLRAEAASKPRGRSRVKRSASSAESVEGGGDAARHSAGAPNESLDSAGYYGTMAARQGLVPRTDESLG